MKPPLFIQFYLFLTIFLWSSAFVGIRIGLTGFSPGALALFRFLIASACMSILYFSRLSPQHRNMSWKNRLSLGLIGIAGIGTYHFCLNLGETTISAGIASFIMGLIPVFAVVLSRVFLQERVTLNMWIGILISLCGLSLMMKSETASSGSTHGIFFILVAAWMGAIHTVAQKRYLINHHPIAVTSWILWGGTLSLFYFLPNLCLEIPKADSSSFLAACYLGIFPAALAYLAWGYVTRYIPVSQAALYLYAMPLISTLLGMLILQEYPSLLSLIGGSIALLGAVSSESIERLLLKTNSLDH